MFRRSLQPKGKNGVVLQPGSTVPVGFAIWNGSAGDRDGKKSVTIWQELKIGK
jgi:DMSO reductase family type II enzyme heme b subunit